MSRKNWIYDFVNDVIFANHKDVDHSNFCEKSIGKTEMQLY